MRPTSVIFTGRRLARECARSRHDHPARGLHHLVQSRNQRHVAACRCRHSSSMFRAITSRFTLCARRRLRLHRLDVRLQHLKIVQAAERVLRALQRRGPAPPRAALRSRQRSPARSAASSPRCGPVQLLRRIHLTGLRRSPSRAPSRASPAARRALAPLLAFRLLEGVGHGRPAGDRASSRLTCSRRLSIDARRRSRSSITARLTSSSAERGSVFGSRARRGAPGSRPAPGTCRARVSSRRIFCPILSDLVPLTPLARPEPPRAAAGTRPGPDARRCRRRRRRPDVPLERPARRSSKTARHKRFGRFMVGLATGRKPIDSVQSSAGSASI